MQALFCLCDLMRTNAGDSGKAHVYANLAEEKLKELSEMMRAMFRSAGRNNEGRDSLHDVVAVA
jgi:hypothetical protein